MKLRLIVLSIGIALTASLGIAADWPQWRGPDRSGISNETGLINSLPEVGPKLLWTFEQAGVGYSGPAIVGNRLYSCGADEDKDKEFVFALDLATGKEAWRTPLTLLSPNRKFTANWGGGPRCTPTVDGERLYVLGAQGDLACLEAQSGKLVWQRNMTKDFIGKAMMNWGYCESPLVDGDKLVCCPGGEDGTVAALNKNTGAVLWRSKDLTDEASYASIVPATIAGMRQYIFKSKDHTAGLAVDDGRLLWKEALGVNEVATIPTPIVHGDFVFTTCGYRDKGGSCGLIKITAGDGGLKSSVVWSDPTLLNHHGGVVLVGDYLYGYTEGDRKFGAAKGWVCVEFKSGKVIWTSDKLEKGSVATADGKLFCWGEKRDNLVLIDASPSGWAEHGRFTPPKKSPRRKAQGGFWTHPVIAHGKLFLRDQELLFCYDLSAVRAEN